MVGSERVSPRYVMPSFEALTTTVISYGGVTPEIVKAPFASVTVEGSPVITTGELAIGSREKVTTFPVTVIVPPGPVLDPESLLHPGKINRSVTSETTRAAMHASLIGRIGASRLVEEIADHDLLVWRYEKEQLSA